MPATTPTQPTRTTDRWDNRPARRRGYWIRDEHGHLSWHTYPPPQKPETEFRPTTTPLQVWPSITGKVVQTRKTTEDETEPHPFTEPVSFQPTTSQTTLSTLVTWWGRTPAWKTVRGYWARDRWSGKMVWHTYTTRGSSPLTRFQSTTWTELFQTSSTTSVPPVRTTSSKTVPTTSEMTTAAAATELGEGGGEWKRNSDADWIWYPSSVDTSLTTKNRAVYHTTSPWSSGSTASTTVTSTSSGTTTTTQPPPTTITATSAAGEPERGDASNRTNRTFTAAVTQPNILPSTSTRAQSVAEKPPPEEEKVDLYDVLTF